MTAKDLKVYLDLGRVSNLPTVWSNVLIAFLLTGVAFDLSIVLPLLIAGSFFYIGGMYLNDAFDFDYDQKFQKFRPIPSGRISLREVLILGFSFLLIGNLIFLTQGGGLTNFSLILALVALNLTILVYDRFHKGYWFAPIIMGGARASLYLTVYLSQTSLLSWPIMVLASVTWAFVILLTEMAKRGLPGKWVAVMIASICLIDGTFGFLLQTQWLALLIALQFPVTLYLQKWVRGT